MPTIHEKPTNTGTRGLDPAKRIPRMAKDAARKLYQSAHANHDSPQETPEGYATDKVIEKGKQATSEGVRDAVDGIKAGIKRGREATRYAKAKEQSRGSFKQEYAKQTQRAENIRIRNRIQGAKNRSFRFSRGVENTAPRQVTQNGKRFAKGGIKTVSKSIKSTSRAIKTGKRTIKTAQQNAKVTAKAAKTAKQAAALAKRAAAQAAKTAVQVAKLTVKAVVAMVKALIAAIKALVAAIAAGGWVALVVILVIAIVAFLIASPLGIFYSGEDKNNRPMPEIIAEINGELDARIAQIASENAADKVVIDVEGDGGMVSNWLDIVAVFAVKTSLGENGADVVTLDEDRIARLKEIFWDMNEITYETSHEGGNWTYDSEKDEWTQTPAETVLTMQINSKSAQTMADEYGFSPTQLELLHEMLRGEFRLMLMALIGVDGGTGLTPEQLAEIYHNLPEGTMGAEIVKFALSRLGDPYSQELRGSGDYMDCSYLVRWCYQQVGIELPGTAAAQGQFCVDNELTISPNDLVPGDLIFFSHKTNGRFMNITHVAIYAGDGMVVDASSSRGEVVYRKLFGGQVLYGRPHILPTNGNGG